jgi:holo-[acyl-carrier protein] synthase
MATDPAPPPAGMQALGLDIVEVVRIREMINRFGDRFMRKIFTDHEIATCMAKARPSESFAARFAAKEAFAKVWPGPVLPGWRDVEVLMEGPRPTFRFDGLATGSVAGLSISHTHAYAAAVVWLVSAPPDVMTRTSIEPGPGADARPAAPPRPPGPDRPSR